MKTPRTVLNKYRVINRLILWNILFAVVLALLVLWGESFAGSPSAEDPPAVPPIEEHVRSDTNQVPANLSVTYKSGLQLAFPMFPPTGFRYEETLKEEEGRWTYRAPCTSHQRIVQRTPIFYRWGDGQRWRPYIQKTYER